MTRSIHPGRYRHGARCEIWIGLLMLAAAMAGCATKPAKPAPAPVSTDIGQPPAAVAGQDVVTVTAGDNTAPRNLSVEEQNARARLEREGSVIYFAYDSSQIPYESYALIAAHATYVNRFDGARMRLEGHTDERGSREYNIGLGERRAQAVRRALEIQGVAANRITTVSYGEERAAASGSNEASWSRNRRVEIRILP